MIQVICRDQKIIYSAYHLVKAFWPGDEVHSAMEETLPERIRVCGDSLADSSISAEDIPGLYQQLQERTGQELPWGMLTGVRPVKLATQWMEEHPEELEGANPEEAFAAWFQADRRVSREKALLAWRIARKEQEMLQAIAADYPHRTITVPYVPGFSLYIGIPFCPSICSYCSFSSGDIGTYRKRVEAYLEALVREMHQRAEEQPGIFPTSIYIGGGTPTSLSAAQLEYLLQQADEIWRIPEGMACGKIREFTVEAGRPDSITREKLEVLKAHGVSRISINPQSMQQKTLDRIGRKHTIDQVYETFALARSLGFDNINMDLIMGLPGESNADVQDTLRQIRQLTPDSLTVHSLAIKRSSAMGMARSRAAVGKGSKVQAAQETPAAVAGMATDRVQLAVGKGSKVQAAQETPAAAAGGTTTGRGQTAACGAENILPDSVQIGKMIEDAYQTAAALGMEPYYLYRQKSIAGNFENIGYARPGREGLYNVLIMEEVQTIIACGAGATTKYVLEEGIPNPARNGQITYMTRSENVKNIEEYIRR